MIEALVERPNVSVADAEFRRLLGYPPGHQPGVQALELASRARQWFADQARPWLYLREVSVESAEDRLLLGGVEFGSDHLRDHLRRAGASRAILAAVSAGRALEEHAGKLWTEGKPDEYYFFETFGSAVVEHLVASLSDRVCTLADGEGLMAIPHYSPGYSGWDVAEQNALFELIVRTTSQAFPEALEVLPSGMLKPKKSLLAVIGLAPRGNRAVARSPCQDCSFAPCRFRREPYRYPPESTSQCDPGKGLYTVNRRALKKWAANHVQLDQVDSRSTKATFRFDGTTCSNLGRPLSFLYSLTVGPEKEGYPILEAGCQPTPGENGYTQMCAYLRDPESLMRSIAAEKPLVGQTLACALTSLPEASTTGCHCDSASRAHKWSLALQAIHYALAAVHSPATMEPTPLSR